MDKGHNNNITLVVSLALALCFIGTFTSWLISNKRLEEINEKMEQKIDKIEKRCKKNDSLHLVQVKTLDSLRGHYERELIECIGFVIEHTSRTDQDATIRIEHEEEIKEID